MDTMGRRSGGVAVFVKFGFEWELRSFFSLFKKFILFRSMTFIRQVQFGKLVPGDGLTNGM